MHEEGSGAIARTMRFEKSEKLACYSIVLSVFLVGFKYLLGTLSGSMALIADAVHSFADVISSFAVFIGIRLSKRKSRAFPYGLYKVENLISLVISLLIFGAGFEVVKTAIMQDGEMILTLVPLSIGSYLFIMTAIYAFSRYELRQGEETGSPSLIADAQQLKADLFSYLVIIGGLIGSYFYLSLDRIMTVIVAFFIGRSGWRIFVDAIRVLLDASVDFTTLDRVKTITSQDPHVREIKELRGRSSGRYKFIEMVLTLKVRSLGKAHYISKNIETRIKESIPQVDRILIHYEPEEKDTVTYAIPLEKDKASICIHFGSSPFFALITAKDNDIFNEEIVSNPYSQEEKRKGIMTSKWLIQKGVDVVLSKSSMEGKGAGYPLTDAGVEIKTVPYERIEEVVNFITHR